jgi:hypothetical protein
VCHSAPWLLKFNVRQRILLQKKLQQSRCTPDTEVIFGLGGGSKKGDGLLTREIHSRHDHVRSPKFSALFEASVWPPCWNVGPRNHAMLRRLRCIFHGLQSHGLLSADQLTHWFTSYDRGFPSRVLPSTSKFDRTRKFVVFPRLPSTG